MKSTRMTASFTIAVVSMLLGIVLVPAGAGEAGQVRIPTAPILYHACMSTGAHTEYDSATFSTKNPGPDLASHTRHLSTMGAAFDAWLTQRHDFHGLAQCFSFATLAEAQNWLQGRKQHVAQLPAVFNNKHFATDWTYESGTAAVASPKTPQTAQPAAPGVPVVFWFCTAIQNGVGYDSAIFEAPNDTLTARRAQLGYAAYLSQKYKFVGGATCRSNPTLAAAQAGQHAYSVGVYSQTSRRVATGWVYKPQE
jgi:hypothetical protein